MALRVSQFLSVLLTAIAFVPGGAHALALPTKIALPEEPYFMAQQIYSGWAWIGLAIVAAIVGNMTSAILARGQPRPFWLSVAASLLIAGTLVIFFVWTYPANQATGNWTTVPDNWEQLRDQWEYSHAVNALLMFVALVCSVLAAILIAARPVVSEHAAASSVGRRGRPALR